MADSENEFGFLLGILQVAQDRGSVTSMRAWLADPLVEKAEKSGDPDVLSRIASIRAALENAMRIEEASGPGSALNRDNRVNRMLERAAAEQNLLQQINQARGFALASRTGSVRIS